MDLSILVVSYNTRDLTLACLEPVYRETREVTFELIVGSDGRGEGFSGPGNVTFDSPSAVDPWHRMPVRRMVAASWGRYNFVLPYGRVIKRYDVAGAAEPVEPPAIVAGA